MYGFGSTACSSSSCTKSFVLLTQRSRNILNLEKHEKWRRNQIVLCSFHSNCEAIPCQYVVQQQGSKKSRGTAHSRPPGAVLQDTVWSDGKVPAARRQCTHSQHSRILTQLTNDRKQRALEIIFLDENRSVKSQSYLDMKTFSFTSFYLLHWIFMFPSVLFKVSWIFCNTIHKRWHNEYRENVTKWCVTM